MTGAAVRLDICVLADTRLGDGSVANALSPVLATGINDAVQVAVGYYATCVVGSGSSVGA